MTERIENKHVFKTFEFLRFPLILGVVFIHCFIGEFSIEEVDFANLTSTDFYNLLRVSISHVGAHLCVPVFFFISGYLFFVHLETWDKNVYYSKLKKRARTLLVPYLLWNLIKIAFVVIGAYIHHRAESCLTYFSEYGYLRMLWDGNVWNTDRVNLLGWPALSSSPIMFQLWFLRDLMCVMVLAPIYHCAFKHLKYIPLIVIAICFLLSIQTNISGFSNEALLFFGTGAYMRINNIDFATIIKKWSFLLYPLAFILWIVCTCFDGHLTATGDLFYPFYIIVGSCVLYDMADTIVNKNKYGIPTIITQSTFFIYLVHTLFIEELESLTKMSLLQSNAITMTLVYIFFPLIICGICTFSYVFMKRIVPRVLMVLTGGR